MVEMVVIALQKAFASELQHAHRADPGREHYQQHFQSRVMVEFDQKRMLLTSVQLQKRTAFPLDRTPLFARMDKVKSRNEFAGIGKFLNEIF